MWFLLEAGVAGLLLVLIIWWTLPKKKPSPTKQEKTGPQE
ncbi:PTS system mannose/fructose/sorbose family transporter subunit IID [Chitinimonas sp. BJB300]|nr:PTS system mannose/fructose/sorbose family transporter subunit IID [Chitinimonas sp. BJB300]